MQYLTLILFVLVQGSLCENCTRTNTKKDFCATSCNPPQNNCSGDSLCVCDGDCGFSCVRQDLRCPRPGKIEHGRRVRFTNLSFGSIARYRCISPYKLRGLRKRVCRGNGKWDGRRPVCKINCPDPGGIKDGSMSHDGFDRGKHVKYSCHKGFTLIGNKILTCSKDGRWDKAKPRCMCRRTNEKAYAYCAKACDPNKKNTCRGNKECLCDGDCGYSCLSRDLSCGKPEKIQNGRRQYSSTRLWDTVTNSCNKPYSLLGSSKRTCRGIKRWDGVQPECKILCTDPGSIEFGSKQPGLRDFDRDYLTVGDKVGYYCFPGYKMEGTSPLVCTDRGEWNNPKPTCVLTTCGRPRIPANAEVLGGKIIKNKVSFNYGAFLRFKCAGGYYLRGMNIPLSCGLTGWSTARFSCHPKSCGDPGSPENGKKKSLVFTFKSKVYFECNYGYKLVGDKYRQCQSNQKWSGQKPTCELIDCGKLQTPEKAKKLVETGTGLNDRVIFECNEKGYEIRGSETRSCLENGTWSGVATSCEIISCGDPGVPMHGRQVNVSNNYKYGSFIEFDCSENYTFSGDRKIVCEETKDWGAPLPRCFAPCSDPGVPRNGTRGGNRFLSEDSVSFECQKGFELKGDETITCVDGVWKGTTPRCEVIKCEDPGTPQNGWKKKGSRYTYDGVVRFRCDTNYTLIGNKKIKCQENKEWTGSIPKCQAPCSHPGQPKHGRIFGDNLKHNSILKIECNTGYVVKGSAAIGCTDGKWNIAVPTCSCGDGIPLGMGNGNILDDAITSSSKTQQNPAHLGRLGGNSYWCSDVESISHLEISLPKKQRITGAVVDVVNGQHIKGFALLAESGNIWDNLSLEAFKSSAKVSLTSEKEVDADKVRIHMSRHRNKESQVCLRAEVYGCDVD